MGSRPVILLDTHVLVWWVAESAKLSAPARRAIETGVAGARLTVSAVSFVEISTLLRRGRLELNAESRQWFAALISLPELLIEPISAEIAWTAGGLETGLPGDPADRIIAATARTLGAKLITADEKLRSSGVVETIW